MHECMHLCVHATECMNVGCAFKSVRAFTGKFVAEIPNFTNREKASLQAHWNKRVTSSHSLLSLLYLSPPSLPPLFLFRRASALAN